jgi:hypothetical protein
MTWRARRAPRGSDVSASSGSSAAEFAMMVDRSFPIDDAAIARIRGRVVGAFIEGTTAPRSPRLGRPTRRRLSLALAATVGLFALSTVAVEAHPGGPFYPLRLAVEVATLPSVDTPAGWDARLARLQRRMEESLAAERDHDEGGLTIALVEYRSELTSLAGGLTDPPRRWGLVARVSRDREIVVGIERGFPSTAASDLIADMQAVIKMDGPDDGNLNGSSSAPHGAATGNPSDGSASDNLHAGRRGNLDTGGVSSDPRRNGRGNRPAGPTVRGKSLGGRAGNPNAAAGRGNPHPSETINPAGPTVRGKSLGGGAGNPNAGAGSGNPHRNGSGNPSGGGKGKANGQSG